MASFSTLTVIKPQGLNLDSGRLFSFSKPQENGENRAYIKGCEDYFR